jgi:hypothetical protein
VAGDPAALTITPAIRRWAMLGWQQQQGRLTSYWRDVLDRDPMLLDAVMVIEMVFGGYSGGGGVVRVATVPVRSVSVVTGARHDAQPKLIEEPELAMTYTMGQGSSAARSLAFSLDPLLIDPVGLITRGLPLAGVAEVVLEHLDPDGGSDHDRRLVLLRGDIDGSVRFGASTGPNREIMEVEIVDPRTSVSSRLPPWVLDEDRIAGIHPSAVGARLPIVFNQFTGIPAQRLTTVLVGSNHFLFAHGHGYGVSSSNGVRVNGDLVNSGDLVYGWALVEGLDKYGNQISYIDFTVGGTAWADSDAVNVTATRADGLGVIEVIRTVLENHSSLGLDGTSASLFAEAAARFPVVSEPQVLINGASGASAATCLEWIEGGYLAPLPMLSMVWEGGAYGPILTDHRLTPIAAWTVGSLPLLDRLSLAEETAKDQIQNDFVLRYGYSAVEDTYSKVATRNATNSDVCAYSQELFGRIDAEPIEAPYFVDDSLAEYVLDWLVEHRAVPSYLVQYEASASVLIEYRRGDTVTLTDAELGFDATPATIEAMSYQRGRVQVTLRVWLRYMNLGGSAVSV